MGNRFAIAIHGGAGTLSQQKITDAQVREHNEALLDALEAGKKVLRAGGKSLDAVQASVMALEDCALFNAGRGAVFSRTGTHEMDAAIMDGASLRAGAVAGITHIRNPIRLARAVLDGDEYVLIAGEKAQELAHQHNIPFAESEYFFTQMRHEEWQRLQQAPAIPPGSGFGTVGAVALDQHGHLAAATSTGGMVNKAYGRIGDSCVIGAGTYADDAACAVSCTGDGEAFIRAVAAYDVACRISYKGTPLQAACQEVLEEKVCRFGGEGGLIAIGPSGFITMPFISEGMYRACCHVNGATEVGIFRDLSVAQVPH